MQAGTGDPTKWFWVPASVPTISSDYKSVGISLSMAGLYPPKDAEIQTSDRHLVLADCPQDGCGDSRWTGYSTICVYGISDICFSQSSENAQSKGWPSAFVLKCLGSTNSQFILALRLKICYSTSLKTPFSFAFFFPRLTRRCADRGHRGRGTTLHLSASCCWQAWLGLPKAWPLSLLHSCPARCCAHGGDVLLIKIKGIRIYLKALRYD